ncbi:MAG TPA: LPS export ABC transporter permease LptG [Pseudolabrys sp.]
MNLISPTVTGTIARYFGLRFLGTALLVFAGIFTLVALLDYIELMRRANDLPNASAILVAKTSLFRVPQVTERIMPFCVLIAAMSCYLSLSRRLELVVARAAGMSAWQFISPALIVAFALGVLATTVYNPVSAVLQERSKRYEAELFGQNPSGLRDNGGNFWLAQNSGDGQAIISAKSSTDQGVGLNGVSVFTFDPAGHFKQRIEARAAELEPGTWRLSDVRIHQVDLLPVAQPEYLLKTSLTAEQVRESFATPETVPFWELPTYINIAEHAGLGAAGYRLQFQKLLARPFLLASMVFLAAAVSLRFFRFGGVQKMVLSGMAAGFLLYVLQKVTEDLSKAELLHPVAAAWLPVLVGGLTGFVALLYQEDG